MASVAEYRWPVVESSESVEARTATRGETIQTTTRTNAAYAFVV